MHATICDLITDLVQNAIEASATEITLTIEENGNHLNIAIKDNGKGMDAETLGKAKDPFWSDGKHRHRRVGLGLPFLFQTVEATGGTAGIESRKGTGTNVAFALDLNHVDVPRFGNLATAVTTLMTYGYEGELKVHRRLGDKGYEASKNELADVLGDLNDIENLQLLKRFLTSQENELNDG